jgi:uncharacterized protein (TIGR03437 family)
MKITPVFAVLIASFATAAPTSLQFVPAYKPVANGVLQLPNGSVAIFGSTNRACTPGGLAGCDQVQPPLLSVLDASGSQTAAFSVFALGSGNSTIFAAAADASGDIWIAGYTDSDDFPLVHSLFAVKPPYMATGFVAKLDSKLNILFSTFWGGPGAVPNPSTPTALALDDSGNAYVIGSTQDPNFPTTAPAFGSGSPSTNAFYAVATKIAADGSALLFSRLLGGDAGPVCGGGPCFGANIHTMAFAIAVDATGNLTLAGTTNAFNFPITANVYQTGGGAFVARISSDGSQLIWSTEIGASVSQTRVSTVQSIALDASGNVYTAGSTPTPITITPDALQPKVPGFQSTALGFAAKLSSDATHLLFATNLGGTNGASLTGLALDPAGIVWITGNTKSSDFPGLSNTPSTGVDFALELNADATALNQIFTLMPPTVTVPPAFDSNGNLLLLAYAGNLLRLNTNTAMTAPAVFAIANSAVPQAAAGASPGELATFYGVAIGPSTPVVAQPDPNGLYPTQLGGVSIQFNGVAAPLLYVGPNQINFQVPFSFISAATVTVTTPNGAVSPMLFERMVGSIGVFGVLNQDGTLNSPTNPAASGSIVSLYLTGLGAPSFGAQSGAIAPSANSAFQGTVEVTSQANIYPLTLLYAGNAPGLINGLDQINVQLPAGEQNPSLVVNRLVQNFGSPAAISAPVMVYAH